MTKKSTPIPGLSFSWKRALGITRLRQNIARATGIPTSKAGVERKIGGAILKMLFGKKVKIFMLCCSGFCFFEWKKVCKI
jgi:hypothetical protein